MASKKHQKLLDEVLKQIQSQVDDPKQGLAQAQPILAYLSWLAWHCSQFSAIPTFLSAARSDIVAILYAGSVGMERSAYLHARSLLENLVRHCYFETRPALFVARCLEQEEGVRDRWQELLDEIKPLPHFRPARQPPTPGGQSTEGSTSVLFSEISAVYAQSSRFVHGSTVRFRGEFKAIEAISFDEKRAGELGDFLRQVSETGILMLALFHLGPYLRISQPIRRYMMGEMRHEARQRFLECMGRVSLAWAKHQLLAAQQKPEHSHHSGGLDSSPDRTVVIKPEV